MNNNEKLISDFYTAFKNRDWKGMQTCYHDEVIFHDPVFPNLKGREAKAMWHMLNAASKDLELVFSNVKADERAGSAHWEAFYSFSRTRRKVHNIIEAQFEFKDGKIFRHTDAFDMWKWSRMALGLSGVLLGWSPVIQNKVRETAMENLKKFMTANAAYSA